MPDENEQIPQTRPRGFVALTIDGPDHPRIHFVNPLYIDRIGCAYRYEAQTLLQVPIRLRGDTRDRIVFTADYDQLLISIDQALLERTKIPLGGVP